MVDTDGPLTLAGAICYLAACQHSTDAGQQQQLAATFYADCDSGFKGVRIDAHMETLLKDLIAKSGKAGKAGKAK